MLKKIVFSCALFFIAFQSFAMDCALSDKHILKSGSQIAPVWLLLVQSKQRVYFHSAPYDACKIKDLFIIHNDSVTAYNFYKDKSNQEWVKVIYYSKRKDLDNEMVEGWIKLKNIPRGIP